ncbi:MAG: GNAT family N-acetyltransferase [Anderseniella sp.]|jgi:ribosomal protein S18 acetylase RimI-like enzyme|nr:GNAT family N-acetyltransferase [Anderseniella sp.]
MPLEINELETARFGIVAARVTDPEAGPEMIEAAARAASVQMLTVRIPTQDLPRVHAFEEAGYRLMDTLVYYSRHLDDLPARPVLAEGISIRQAVPEDAGAVAAVARAGFRDYIGHYHADPRLDATAADAAYVEWAETSTASTSPAAPALVAERGGKVVGFLTLRSNSPEEMEIVLNAMAPASQGQGIYGMLVDAALALAKANDSLRVITSTQINNYAVQRVWTRFGFFYYRSLYTFHKWF